MKAIVAVDSNWAIGYQGRLLVSIRADQQNFKNLTMGNRRWIRPTRMSIRRMLMHISKS